MARDYKGIDSYDHTKVIPVVYENHPADSRIEEMGDVCSTVTSRWGTGGGNVPFATAAFSIREDAQANNFSATELEVATALKALQPSAQSHHAQTFVAQPIGVLGSEHPNAAVTEDFTPTLTSAMGTGGGHIPVVEVDCYPISTQNALGRVNGREDWPLGLFNEGEPSPTLTKSHGHAVALAYNFSPGKGDLKDDIHVTQTDTSKTLDAVGSNPNMHQGGTGIVQPKVFSFDSVESNSMKSSNPDSGCREVDLSKTLDTTQPNPAKGQGGIGILQPIAFSAIDDGRDATEGLSPTLRVGGNANGVMGVAFDTYNQTLSDVNQTIKSPVGGANESIGTVLTPALTASMAVRRLTPTECERLQGFPDGYTNIKKNCPDGPRYKALGNSMAVPVMRWIGQRIADYEKNVEGKQ
jgi:site-specific DNA-cytosine methylase